MTVKKQSSSRHYTEKTRLLDLETLFQKIAAVLAFLNMGLAGAAFFQTVRARPILSVLAVLLAAEALLVLGALWFRKKWSDIEKAAGSDDLTGISNRASFEKTLEQEQRRAGRYHYPITLCILDLDNFRSYNEQFGTKRGDELLQQFALFLKSNVRSTDCVARYGSDEFCAILPHTDLVKAEKFVARVLAQAQEMLDASFSAGLTAYRAGETKGQLLMRAGLALHQAKREGKKRICCLVGGQDNTVLSL